MLTPSAVQPASSQSSVSSPAPAASAPGQTVDASQYLEKMQGIESELGNTKKALSETSKTAKEAQELVSRMKQVFGEEKAGPTEEQQDEAQLDEFLSTILEYQKQGIEVPMTAKIAMKLMETRMDNRKKISQLENQLKKVTDKQDFLADPNVAQDNAVFGAMDNHLHEALDGLYGNVDPNMFEAVARSISKEVARLKAEKPEDWAQVKRSPEIQRNMVNHFARRAVPPKALEVMQNEKIKNTPLTEHDLITAFREANDIEDPKERQEVKTKIRQELWAQKFSSPSLSKR